MLNKDKIREGISRWETESDHDCGKNYIHDNDGEFVDQAGIITPWADSNLEKLRTTLSVHPSDVET